MEIKTKFNVGDVVWRMMRGTPIEAKIRNIVVSAVPRVSVSYHFVGGTQLDERECFATKEELRDHVFG